MNGLLTLDSSAIIAILNAEPEADQFVAAVSSAPRIIGAPTALEVGLWMIRRTPAGRTPFTDELFGSPDTEIIAFDAALERIAHDAAARYGVGRHPAALNFGDCMA